MINNLRLVIARRLSGVVAIYLVIAFVVLITRSANVAKAIANYIFIPVLRGTPPKRDM